jgi:hypothetical protein
MLDDQRGRAIGWKRGQNHGQGLYAAGRRADRDQALALLARSFSAGTTTARRMALAGRCIARETAPVHKVKQRREEFFLIASGPYNTICCARPQRLSCDFRAAYCKGGTHHHPHGRRRVIFSREERTIRTLLEIVQAGYAFAWVGNARSLFSALRYYSPIARTMTLLRHRMRAPYLMRKPTSRGARL